MLKRNSNDTNSEDTARFCIRRKYVCSDVQHEQRSAVPAGLGLYSGSFHEDVRTAYC